MPGVGILLCVHDQKMRKAWLLTPAGPAWISFLSRTVVPFLLRKPKPSTESSQSVDLPPLNSYFFFFFETGEEGFTQWGLVLHFHKLKLEDQGEAGTPLLAAHKT